MKTVMDDEGRAHGSLAHFTVHDLRGREVAYSTIWQRRHLLLVSLTPAGDEASASYISALEARAADLTAHDTVSVITHDLVPGVPRPGVVIADRWGEVYFVTGAAGAAGLPGPDALVEWLRFVQVQCPECQAEAR
jgi:hypothetical protein